MERRKQLEERRIRLDEEMHEAFRELDGKNLPGPMLDSERRAIERRFETQMEDIEREIRNLEAEMDQFWADRETEHRDGERPDGVRRDGERADDEHQDGDRPPDDRRRIR
jgi:hypothetical protein